MAAETVTPSEITGPLSFRAGDEDYILDGLYAPEGHSGVLTPYLQHSLEVTGEKRDRWARLRVTSPAALELLRTGTVQLMPMDSAPTAELIAAEDEARRHNRGLWNTACCRVLVV